MKQTQKVVYLPPALPEYLKNVYDLKPIVGSPNDDEVKGIQTVIRAAQNAAQIPGMFNPEISMSLAQHLFEIQMARYREKYPCSMFPDDMVHTPPTLPPHVTFTLEPVVGVPSDEELQVVQAAVRGYEQMAIFPSMFDPTVSMELSQHLFNIQLARYMHNAPRAGLGKNMNNSRSPFPPSQTRQPLDIASGPSNGRKLEISNEPNASDPTTVHQAAPSPQTESAMGIASLQVKVAESNDRLTTIADTLDSVKQVLIRTQQNYALSTYSTYDSKGQHQTDHLETMNDEGQLPTSQGLPLLMRDDSSGAPKASELSSENLSRYLQFYNLGGDLLHPGDTPTIRDDKRGDAESRLVNYIEKRVLPS